MKKPLITTYRPDNYSSRGRTYVVLGAPRGGTSMLAGSIQILGIPMGSVDEQHEDPVFHDEKNTSQMIRTILKRNNELIDWGWKLPNTIYYYREISSYLRNPVFLIIYRNPFDVFMSAASKDGTGLNDPTFNAPVYHYAKIHQLVHDEETVPAYLMSYEAACQQPAQFVSDLARTLAITPSELALEACRQFVSPERGYTGIEQSGPRKALSR